MTSWEAKQELEKSVWQWMDFECWAYYQLIMREEYSNERMHEVCENHKKAEQRFNEYKAETQAEIQRMYNAGADTQAITAYRKSRYGEHEKLLKAWRSLEGKVI